MSAHTILNNAPIGSIVAWLEARRAHIHPRAEALPG
jgi:hypothetical protein